MATGAADGTVKLWNIPSEGLTSNLTAPTAKFDGYDIVHTLAYHPSASNILAAGHKNGLSVLDLEAGAEKYSFKVEGFGKDIASVHWNYNGSLVSTVGKNAALSIFDPRTGGENILSSSTPNALVKKLQHGLFIGGDNGQNEFLLLFGVSSTQRPVVQWVDPRNPTIAVKTHDFQFSQGYSLPQYDRDTNTVYYSIRGSEMISLLDVEIEKTNQPTVWQSHTFVASQSVKGFCLLPKRATTTNVCEVNRVFTLGADAVEAYSITIPRKIAGFHAELYPDTPDIKPAQTGAQWIAGSDKAPLKTSMVAIHESGGSSAASAAAASAAGLVTATSRLAVSAPTSSSPAPVPATASPSPTSASSSSSSSSITPTSRAASGSVSVPAGRDRGASAAYVPSATRVQIDNMLKKSIFTHCSGKEPPSQFQSYFDMKLASTLPLGENIRANSAFFAVPWKTSGGSAIAVFRLAQDALGRCPPTQFCVRGHKSQASTFDFSTFDQQLLATGSLDGQVYLWKIPVEGLKSDLNEPTAILSCAGKVTFVRFHPYIADLLVVVTSGFDGHSVEFWNISDLTNQEKPSLSIAHPEPIIDVAFHPLSHLIATTSKDGKSRVIHVASQKVLLEFTPPESVKDTRIIWTGNHKLVTVGFGSGGQRSFSLHDVTNGHKLVQTIELDRVSYVPLPRYDLDTGLLYLANVGGRFIPLYQINDSSIDTMNLWQTANDTNGFVLLSKTLVDVKKVEIHRALQLTKDAVLPITYTVPRKRVRREGDKHILGSERIRQSSFHRQSAFSSNIFFCWPVSFSHSVGIFSR